MKKLATFSLLAVFLFNSIGYYLTFFAVRAHHKNAIVYHLKLSIPEKQLRAFTFEKSAVNQIVWESKGKEFFLNGDLFDVVRTTETASTITYHCISDSLESKLYDLLTEFSSENSEKQSNKGPENSVLYCVNFKFPFAFYNPSVQLVFPISTENYVSAIAEISPPPPKQV